MTLTQKREWKTQNLLRYVQISIWLKPEFIDRYLIKIHNNKFKIPVLVYT